MDEKTQHLEQIVAKEETRLQEYLDGIASLVTDNDDDDNGDSESLSKRRIYCCHSSRSLYCPQCTKILIPPEYWPSCYHTDPILKLPFTMDIILGWKERRTSSTGLQMIAISKTLSWEDTQLFDMNRGDTIPSYAPQDESTFVLFPQKGRSVSLSSVAHKLQKLVVLDVKWSRSGIVQLDPALAELQTVHLEFPPRHSHFWRWHNQGEKMLSTIEAIFFAAVEVSVARGWSTEERERIIHIMWLFALQRHAIARQGPNTKAAANQKPLPFSKEGKDRQRAARFPKAEGSQRCHQQATQAQTAGGTL